MEQTCKPTLLDIHRLSQQPAALARAAASTGSPKVMHAPHDFPSCSPCISDPCFIKQQLGQQAIKTQVLALLQDLAYHGILFRQLIQNGRHHLDVADVIACRLQVVAQVCRARKITCPGSASALCRSSQTSMRRVGSGASKRC